MDWSIWQTDTMPGSISQQGVKYWWGQLEWYMVMCFSWYCCFCIQEEKRIEAKWHICISKLGHHWFKHWLVPHSPPSHFLKQCWFIVNHNHATNFNDILWKLQNFNLRKCIWNCHLQNRTLNSQKTPPEVTFSDELCSGYFEYSGEDLACYIWLHSMNRFHYTDGLVQGRCKSSALAMEWCLSCIKPTIPYVVLAMMNW